MAKFDVFRTTDGGHWLDCQNNLLRHLNTRLVVPLASPDDAVQVERRLTPILDVAGDEMIMLTHFAAAVPTRALGRKVASVEDQETVVGNALDLLISGY